LFDEDEMLDMARRHTVAELRLLCRYARYAADPDGFCRDEEESFERRRLHISPMADGMHVIDGVLDPVGGAAVRTALEALATSGPSDGRKHSQLMADSMVIDVGRATRIVSGPARRALKVRDQGCRFPGCDRPINWTSPYHIEFWGRGGKTNVPDLVSVCYFHHRLVHEGGWQVVK